jgi:hypothetical protein
MPSNDVTSEAAEWADCGGMALTGGRGGPPQLVAGTPATAAREGLATLAALADSAGLDPSQLPDTRLLGERAALMGLSRRGRVSAGGATRLLDTADGAVAITLSRPDDSAALPALFETDATIRDPWAALTAWCREHRAADIAERAGLLGLAAGAVDTAVSPPPNKPIDRAPARPLPRPPVVVDLSALWAGPLCAQLLGLLGARIVTIESGRRLDPTRWTAPAFHDLLRAGSENVTLDFTSLDDRHRLAELIAGADVVIEASRPRALAQLGIDAAHVARSAVWVSITAYGRDSNRIGYGDDVAAAAGLLGDGPVFAGDALADPLTGVHAAVAALARLTHEGSGLVEVSMYEVARAARGPVPEAEVVERDGRWFVDDGKRLTEVRSPSARQPAR